MLQPALLGALRSFTIYPFLFVMSFTGSPFASAFYSRSARSGSLMRSCLVGTAPHYLMAYCTPVSSLPSRSSLRSPAHGHLVVPRVCTSTAQSRSFAIVGPSSWNWLPQSLRSDLLSLSFDQFRKRLKTSLFNSEDTVPGRERL